jgi:hypothetical protein
MTEVSRSNAATQGAEQFGMSETGRETFDDPNDAGKPSRAASTGSGRRRASA